MQRGVVRPLRQRGLEMRERGSALPQPRQAPGHAGVPGRVARLEIEGAAPRLDRLGVAAEPAKLLRERGAIGRIRRVARHGADETG